MSDQDVQTIADYRASLLKSADAAVAHGKLRQARAASGQRSLFGETNQPDLESATQSLIDMAASEYEVLGTFMTWNPLEQYAELIQRQCLTPRLLMDRGTMEISLLGGIIVHLDVQTIKTGDNQGKKYCRFLLHTLDGDAKVNCWSAEYARYQSIIKDTEAVFLWCRLNRRWLRERDPHDDNPVPTVDVTMIVPCSEIAKRISQK